MQVVSKESKELVVLHIFLLDDLKVKDFGNAALHGSPSGLRGVRNARLLYSVQCHPAFSPCFHPVCKI